MEYVVIAKEMTETIKRKNEAMKQLWKLSADKAETERAYRIALAQEILSLKYDKVQATLIPDIARGNTAELKHKRDLSEALYNTTRESLKSLQGDINAYQTIIKYQQELESEN